MFTFFHLPDKMSHSCMCCCYCFNCSLCVFIKINPYTVCVAYLVRKLTKFGAEQFIVLGIYCLKMIWPLNFTITLSAAKCSDRL
jgi:hypothetical protein